MKPVRPRRLTHRGVVEAAGFVVDPALLGEAATRRRVLSAWEPGSRVIEAGSLLVLKLATTRRVPTWRAPGAPLVVVDRRAGVLSSAPLEADELTALAPPPESAVLVRGGVAHLEPLSGRKEVDVSAWLAVESFALVDGTSLGLPPAPAALSTEPVSLDVRKAFGAAVLPAPPEAAAVAAALRGEPLPEVKEAGAPAGRRLAPLAAKLLEQLAAALKSVGDFLSPHGPPPASGQTVSGSLASAAPSTATPRKGLLTPLLRALRGLMGAGAGAGAGKTLASATKPAPPRGTQARGRLDWVWEALFGNEEGPAQSAAPGRAPAAPLAPLKPPPPSALERLRARLQELAAKLLVATRLAPVVGRRQAEYIVKMMEMFQSGDLKEALRHAIPLGGESSTVAPPALGVPAARDELRISPASKGPASSMGFGTDLYVELQRLYRRAFEKLAAQGRLEEAAFVLAELLHANEEAVNFLEKHGRLRLAAEIAEARSLPPGFVVRQWFLAGDPVRAVAIARRTGAFSDAVTRLERSHPERARSLRLIWADTLADAGDFAAAVEVAWPVTSARPIAAEWIARAIEAGGPGAARMLVRRVVLSPETFPEVRDQVVKLCEDEALDTARVRTALGAALLRETRTPELAVLARPATRAVLRDRAAFGGLASSDDVSRLARLADDAALSADLPVISPGALFTPLIRRDPPLEIVFSSTDVGTTPIRDAAVLPSGQLLIALGEGGARLLTRDGRSAAHFDVPAHRLVVSDHGQRAIALARRGEVQRLSRIDLASRKADHWCEARVDRFSADFDGSLWFIAEGDSVVGVDAMGSGFKALWRVSKLGAPVAAMARSAHRLVLLTGAETQESWSYELPSPTLRGRLALTRSVGPLCAVSPHGATAGILTLGEEGETLALLVANTAGSGSVTQLWGGLRRGALPLTPQLGVFFAALPSISEGQCQVAVLDLKSGMVRALLVFQAASQLAVRLHEETLVIADDRGRLIVMDLDRGELLRDLRV